VGIPLANQPRNTLNEDSGLAGSGSGHNQHWAMNMLNGQPLLRIGEDRGNLTRYCH